MARKTKKQKIIADSRRKFSVSPAVNLPINNSSNTENYEATTNLIKPQTKSIYIYPVHLIRKDLTKTILLSILAISLEIALYFILERH